MSFGMNFGQSGYSGYNPYGGQQNPYASFANNMSLGAVNNQFYSPLMQSPFLQNSYGISMQANPLFNQGAWSSMVDMAAQNHDYLKTLMNNQPQKDIPPFVSSDHSNNPFNTSNSNNPNGTSTLNNQTSSTNNNADPQSVSRIKALLSQADNDNDIGQGDDDGKTSFGEWQALEDDYRFDLDTIQGDIDLKETELADLRDTFDSLDQSVDSDRQQALELKRQYDQLNKELAALRSKENDYQT